MQEEQWAGRFGLAASNVSGVGDVLFKHHQRDIRYARGKIVPSHFRLGSHSIVRECEE